jgi:hypothetical protein
LGDNVTVILGHNFFETDKRAAYWHPNRERLPGDPWFSLHLYNGAFYCWIGKWEVIYDPSDWRERRQEGGARCDRDIFAWPKVKPKVVPAE